MHKNKITQTTNKIIKIIPLAILVSCSTTNKKNELIKRSLDKQNKLITKIQKQRNQKKLKTKISSNNELMRSEKVLNFSLQKIIESNTKIIESLKKKRNKAKGRNYERFYDRADFTRI